MSQTPLDLFLTEDPNHLLDLLESFRCGGVTLVPELVDYSFVVSGGWLVGHGPFVIHISSMTHPTPFVKSLVPLPQLSRRAWLMMVNTSGGSILGTVVLVRLISGVQSICSTTLNCFLVNFIKTTSA